MERDVFLAINSISLPTCLSAQTKKVMAHIQILLGRKNTRSLKRISAGSCSTTDWTWARHECMGALAYIYSTRTYISAISWTIFLNLSFGRAERRISARPWVRFEPGFARQTYQGLFFRIQLVGWSTEQFLISYSNSLPCYKLDLPFAVRP